MSDSSEKTMEKKTPMTDEERMALADKLDKDLDTWINGLEQKSYKDGWSEENWEQEMEKHPFFMTKFPDNPSEASPLLQGIQQLKYDETANTPLELATSYKEDGNFNFKHKKYRMAIISYTEGLRKKCGDIAVEASLYNNRSAAQFFLKNYRSSFMDCKKCLELDPEHVKAKIRAIQCCIQMKKPEDVIEMCSNFLEKQPDSEQVKDLKNQALSMLKVAERNRRKEERFKKLQDVDVAALRSAVEKRGIQVEVEGDPEEVLLGMHEKPRLLPDGTLTWPVFFLYPEHSTSDFVQEFHENETLLTMLEEVLRESPDWDTVKAYHPPNLSIYYEGGDRSHLYVVNAQRPLSEVLKSKEFIARDWRPAFLVFVRSSVAEKNFINNYTVIS